MKLASLGIKNFRQFYGAQELHFAAGEGGKNVTVIHGYNGAGKTALLNAFIWCLYGETTPDLEAPNRLENERAVAEAGVGDTVEVSVRLMFEHGGATTIVERRKTSTKQAGNTTSGETVDLRMWVKNTTGEIEQLGKTGKERQGYIQQMLPSSLYPFFFFNGERVERLASPEAYDEVESGVKTLLDVTLFDRSITHLQNSVVPDLSRELRSHSDQRLTEALDLQESLKTEHGRLQADLAQKHEQIKALDLEIEEYERRQSAIESLSTLTQQRDMIRSELQRYSEADKRVEADLKRTLSTNGYLAFAEPVFAVAESLVRDARQRGEIPAKIKPQFVNDLMAKAVCVCGRSIAEGSPEWDTLIKWREATGLAELEEAISQTAASLPSLRQRAADFSATVERLQKERSEILAAKREQVNALALVEGEIGERSLGEDAVTLKERLLGLRQELTTRRSEQIVAERDLKSVEERQHEIKEQLKTLQAQGDKAKLLKRQIEAVERVVEALQKIFAIRKDTVRRLLDEQIGAIWRDAALKDYRASVSENYRLILTKRVGAGEQTVHGASTGEKQVLALSFVASLVKSLEQSSEDRESGRQFGLALGGVFPLVMDSPFGSLEDFYREKVAEWVPKLAQQVVVLVSSTQWRDEAERALAAKIGRSYILELHTTKENAERPITLRGNDYPYVVHSQDAYEFTAIQEVK